MNESAAAQILGAHVVLSSRSAELWHRVALGELRPEEAEARLLEGRHDVSEEERAELERAKQVFAPTTEAQREERLEALLAWCTAERDGHSAVVVPVRSHRSRRWMAGLVALAAAVVLTVWLVPPAPEVHRRAFMASYEVELDVTSASHRGGVDPTEEQPRLEGTTLGPKDKLKIILRAVEEVEGPVGVLAYAWDRSGRARRLELEPTVYANGVVVIETTVAALGLGLGEHELVFVVGWADGLPSSWEEVVALDPDGSAGSVALRQRVRVELPRLSEDGGDE